MSFKFDQIANIYNKHVNSHIPNYKIVIEKSVDICKDFERDAAILDFGSANGSTLQILHDNGFNNLYGVEINRIMLDYSPNDIAIYNETIPDLKFDIIMANWVLHFNSDKFSILKKLYEHLNTYGVIIISEKTITSETVKKHYYNFKKFQGVTEEEIIDKEQSLKGVMYLESIEWYLYNLKKVGFLDIDIIDASWGFVTILARKI